MTDTELRLFLNEAQELFPRCPWKPREWQVFTDKIRHQPFKPAMLAIEEHRARTPRYNTPSIPDVLDLCKQFRFGPTAAEPGEPQRRRTADDVVSEFRWTWQSAVRMYGVKDAIRQFASSDATRHVPELAKLGWTADQIDVVIQEITGGEVTDSFRACQAGLRETWSQRGHGRRSPLRGILATCAGRDAHPSRVREGAVAHGRTDDTADRKRDGLSELAGSAPISQHAETESPVGGQAEAGGPETPDDNDLTPGTYIDIADEDIPF
jgi:hypothetical protein